MEPQAASVLQLLTLATFSVAEQLDTFSVEQAAAAVVEQADVEVFLLFSPACKLVTNAKEAITKHTVSFFIGTMNSLMSSSFRLRR